MRIEQFEPTVKKKIRVVFLMMPVGRLKIYGYLDTALALFATAETLNKENPLEPFALHMGINSGSALVGSTRYEGRRGSRWIFTADGPVINLASRLAGIAKPGELLLGPSAAQRLAGRYSLCNRGFVSLKNISKPIEVFCLSEVSRDLP